MESSTLLWLVMSGWVLGASRSVEADQCLVGLRLQIEAANSVRPWQAYLSLFLLSILRQNGQLQTEKNLSVTSQISKVPIKRFRRSCCCCCPEPRPIAISDRLKAYNGVLSKIDPSKIIRVIPNPTVTLTPAAPRSPDGKGSIGLVTSDANGSCYWDTDPNFS